MALTQDERRRIYEEEKARLEAEERDGRKSGKTFALPPELAGLLCYLGMWVTGIVFLALEQKDRTVRFHAAQSLVTFGALTLLSAFLHLVPVAGAFFAVVVGVSMFAIWLVLLVKTYRGEFYRLPVAAKLADILLKAINSETVPEKAPELVIVPPSAPAPPRPRIKDITESAFAIFFNIAALVFLNFFHECLAWKGEALTTSAWPDWLLVFNVAAGLTIAGHLILIFNGGRLVREAVRINIDVFSFIAIGFLITIFPFDFSPLPVSETMIGLVLRIGLGVAMLVIAATATLRFVRLIMAVVRG